MIIGLNYIQWTLKIKINTISKIRDTTHLVSIFEHFFSSKIISKAFKK